MDSEPPPRSASLLPTEDNARLASAEAVALMTPIVRWLLRSGVPYTAFADLLKGVFVAVAGEELAHGGARVTHSALSVLSGVHRKDVRQLVDAPPRAAVAQGVPLASQLFTRWITDPSCCNADGAPRSLPRSGPAPSFEALARQLSSDVHPRTVLDELLRLGLVTLSGDEVVPRAAAFLPATGLAETTALFSANAADHLAAAVHNLTEPGPKFLEQSLFANGLTEDSAAQLAEAARAAWAKAFATMVREAQQRVDADAASDGNSRVRFGVYFYSEPERGAAPDSPPVAPK
jgi:hypothetical protein